MKRSARVGLPTYTYRQEKIEEKLIYRRLAIIGGLTLVLLLIIWFWGLTFIRIIGVLGTKELEETPTTDLELPLLKPAFTELPEFTNGDKITISGFTTANVSVVLTVNGAQVSKSLSDNDGNFTFVGVVLKEGINLVKVAVSNEKGETKEERATITVDKQPPNLQISAPTNGQNFPKDTKNIAIKGSTEPESTVFINSIQTILDQNGNFSHQLEVSPGENKIEVKATDKAGNSKVINLIVTVET